MLNVCRFCLLEMQKGRFRALATHTKGPIVNQGWISMLNGTTGCLKKGQKLNI